MPVHDPRSRAEAQLHGAAEVIARCLLLGDSGDPFIKARHADLVVLSTSIAPDAVHAMGTKRLRAHVKDVAVASLRLEADFDEVRERRAAEARRRAEIERVAKMRELARLEAEHEVKFTDRGRPADLTFDLRESGPG